MSKPVYILGTGLSHDGSSCLLRDGCIEVAIEKERLTRQKHDGFNDALTLNYCLNSAGIDWKDVALLVENNTINRFELEDQERRRGRNIPAYVPRINISHHIAHAYSAIGPSPFSDATVLVIDGRGSSLNNCTDLSSCSLPEEIQYLSSESRDGWFEKLSVYRWRDGRLEAVFKDFSRLVSKDLDRTKYPLAAASMEHSIGEFYGGVSYYVFGKDFQDGKLMGLAPYGREGMIQGKGLRLINGRVFNSYEDLPDVPASLSGAFYKRADRFQTFADLALWAQRELERVLVDVFATAYSLAPSKNICYAGGVALNAVANRRVKKAMQFQDLYIQPAAADSGVALGCCYYGWLEILKQNKNNQTYDSAFGHLYDSDRCRRSVECLGSTFRVTEPNDIATATAQRIAQGKVVAWFQGRSEFGPRALGHRSILADPRRVGMRDFINHSIKLREDFRPFAPSVTLDDAGVYFEGDSESPFMILVMDTRTEWIDKLPAVIHRDGTARVQTVSPSRDQLYYRLLRAFQALTGIPIVLNTSFNRRGMPIVETPEQATQFFAETPLDSLAIDRYLIDRGNFQGT